MIDEVISRITKTDLSVEPFEHKFIKEIFPKNFYQQLIENLPNKGIIPAEKIIEEQAADVFVIKPMVSGGFTES